MPRIEYLWNNESRRTVFMRNLLPIISIVTAIFVIWYGAAVALNAAWAQDKATRAGVTLSFGVLVADTWSQEKDPTSGSIRW